MMSDTHIIEITDLVKVYEGGFRALNHINLNIKRGDFFALLGPNGAGKSTTIGILTSLVNKTGGKIMIKGVDLDENPSLVKSYMGVVPQEININIFETCFQVLVHQAAYYGIPRKEASYRADKLLAQLQLSEKRNTQTRLLSGGMKRRLMIARALIHEPEILILDEPTAGVDIEIRQVMWQFIREYNQRGGTIILTTHYLEEAENLCKNIAIIDHGEVIEQTTIKSLLEKLAYETLVLQLVSPLQQAPQLHQFSCTLVEPDILEVEILREQTASDLFSALKEQQIEVMTVRTKESRLERLFINLIRHQEKEVAA